MQRRTLCICLCLGEVGNLFADSIPCSSPDQCKPCYCIGPENEGGNASVRPKTCNGDWTPFIAVIYWNAHQSGMEYAVKNAIRVPVINPSQEEIQQLNHLIESKYETPPFNSSFGYRLGLGYNTACDGWDLGIYWTHFNTASFSDVETDAEDTHSLIALWSAFSPAQGSVLYARNIETVWKLRLNLVDVELGREFWTSKYLAFHPFIGVRYGSIRQDFDLKHRGGSWSPRMTPDQFPFNNLVNLDNDYKGFGIRCGMDTTWHVQCGWGLFGNCATSILYGRFNVQHDEENQLAMSPHTRTTILQTKGYYRASRAILDLTLGIEWSSVFGDCDYAVTGQLGWEQHYLFHQNQLWRVTRINDVLSALPNNNGENAFEQRRGTLDTQGLIFSIKVEY